MPPVPSFICTSIGGMCSEEATWICCGWPPALAAGDIAQCRRDRDGRIVDAGRAAATAELLGAEIAAAEADGVPVRVLALGDLAYPSGTRADFACFGASWGRYAGRLLPVPGNHEHRRPNPDAAPYYEFFGGNPLVSANGP